MKKLKQEERLVVVCRAGGRCRFWFGIWYFSLYTVALFRQGELSAAQRPQRGLANIGK